MVFSSPFVPRVSGDPAKASIVGYDALRSYVDQALRRTPGIRYTLDATYSGTEAIILLYSRQIFCTKLTPSPIGISTTRTRGSRAMASLRERIATTLSPLSSSSTTPPP